MRFLLLTLMLATSLAAETFYLDPAHGKPGNKGTAESPLRTLEEAVRDGLLGRVKAGDTILLRDGLHGRVVFSGANDDFVTIAAEKGHKPRLSYLEITSGAKWRIRGLTVSASFGEPYSGVMLKFADGGESADIVVEDCFVYSTLDTSSWSAEQWMKCNSGITMGRHGTGHVLRNNYVMNTRFGINLCAEGGVCEGNVVSHFSADGIRATRDGQIVKHNVIRNIYVSDADGDKNHDDAIQVFLFNVGTGTVRNMTISENLIIMRESEDQPHKASMQGIGCFDGPLINFTVEGNVINTAHWHGVSLYDAEGCKINRNVIFSQWTDTKLRPWIELGTKKKGEVKGNQVKGNHAYSFKLSNDKEVDAADNKTITEEIYRKAEADLLAKIEAAFGPVHAAAGFRRTGLEQPRWIEGAVADDHIDAVQNALGKGQRIVLYVYADGKREAEACRKFEREVLEDAAAAALLDNCVRVRVRLDDALTRDARKRYFIPAKGPGIVILDDTGAKLWAGASPSARTLIKQLE